MLAPPSPPELGPDHVTAVARTASRREAHAHRGVVPDAGSRQQFDGHRQRRDSYDVVRLDGACSSVESEAITHKRPPNPKCALVPWQRYRSP
jgi:hypothetical protein